MKVNRKIVWISAGVILLAGFGFAVFMLVRGISSFNTAQATFDVTLKDYKGLYERSSPFPSDDNLSIEKKNIDTIQDWIVNLIAALKRKQIDPDPQNRNPTSFINLLGEKQKSLQAAAKLAGTTMREVKDGFAAGFEKYAQGGVLPAADDVPRLTQQVAIIEAICNILFEEKVKEILTIRRQEFDGAAIGVVQPSRTSAGQRGARGTAPAAASRTGKKPSANSYRVANAPWGGEQKQAGEFEGKELYTRMKFFVEFKARESSILNILNRFASSEMFMVVTSIDIETEPESGPGTTVAGRVGSPGDSGSGPVVATNAPVVPSGALKNRPRKDRIIMGVDLEKAATVKIEIDVYRFRDEKDAG